MFIIFSDLWWLANAVCNIHVSFEGFRQTLEAYKITFYLCTTLFIVAVLFDVRTTGPIISICDLLKYLSNKEIEDIETKDTRKQQFAQQLVCM